MPLALFPGEAASGLHISLLAAPLLHFLPLLQLSVVPVKYIIPLFTVPPSMVEQDPRAFQELPTLLLTAEIILFLNKGRLNRKC